MQNTKTKNSSPSAGPEPWDRNTANMTSLTSLRRYQLLMYQSNLSSLKLAQQKLLDEAKNLPICRARFFLIHLWFGSFSICSITLAVARTVSFWTLASPYCYILISWYHACFAWSSFAATPLSAPLCQTSLRRRAWTWQGIVNFVEELCYIQKCE